MIRTPLLLAAIFSAVACGGPVVSHGPSTPEAKPPASPADVVYNNGKIYTVNKAMPWAESLAVKDGKLMDVGSAQELAAYVGEGTRVVDLGGKFVMPGINDLHHHGGEVSLTVTDKDRMALSEEQLVSPEAIAAAVKAFADSHPDLEVIFVEGYPDGMFPGNNADKALLDKADAKRPIIILCLGGHSFWVNSAALAKAGITAETPDPPYGAIARKPGSKEPLGTVHESAMGLMWKLVAMPSPEKIRAGYLHHTARVNGLGITGVRIATATQTVLETVSAMDKAGELNAYHSLAFGWRTSFVSQIGSDFEVIKQQVLNSKNFATENVSSMALKYLADGAPASKTAYLLEDYVNDPGNRGQLQMDSKLMAEEFAFWNANGVTTMTHVVGDAAARLALDAVEAAQKANGVNGLRHHLTHSVMVHPDDRPRLKQLGMVADVSPAVAAPMAFHNAYKHHYGAERHEQFFPARQLIEAGATVALASDYPVGPDSPWINLETWTTRMNPHGEAPGTMGADSAITLEQALEASTMAGAYGLYMDKELGSLETGKRATFIVLDRNPFEIPPADLSEIQVEQTYFSGKKVYEKTK